METKVTCSQIERVANDWSNYAKEQIKVSASDIYSPVYAFGSELACLRIFNKLKTGDVKFSDNLGTWYYVNKIEGK
jgi:hypothetical protein